ncbi:MAG TPA: RNA 2',3'-cyclic phosphodiesterase [Candidatus Nanoarchaeia archaeon]|nr:RNA 2',3'-cyclic phosphodiesterase [Candidatus Nanoarchaeia archaeon]
MARTFISIDIPENIKKEIKKIQDSLLDFKGKKTEPENLHLTLKFLGEINDKKVESVKEKLKSIRFNKFETEAVSLGVFSENFIRIVWIHLINCEELQKEIDNKLSEVGFAQEDRFMGHLTIARIKHTENKAEFLENIKRIKLPKIKFSVDKFRLKSSILTSEGPVYKTLGEYKLT